MLTDAKARKRLVTFRVTDAEFDVLRQICIAENWRSISEFARSAVLSRVQLHREPTGSLNQDLTTLSSRLKEIDSALNDVSGLIRKVLGPETPE